MFLAVFCGEMVGSNKQKKRARAPKTDQIRERFRCLGEEVVSRIGFEPMTH